MTDEEKSIERLRFILMQHLLNGMSQFPKSDLLPYYRRFMLALVALSPTSMYRWMVDEAVIEQEAHADIADTTVTLFRELNDIALPATPAGFETMQFRPAGPAQTAIERWYQPKHTVGLNPLIDNRTVSGGMDAALISVLASRKSQVGT